MMMMRRRRSLPSESFGNSLLGVVSARGADFAVVAGALNRSPFEN